MTANFVQDVNDRSKVTVSIQDDAGRTVVSFLLKPKAINFIAAETASQPELLVRWSIQNGSDVQECVCNFKGILAAPSVGGLSRTMATGSAINTSQPYYAIARNVIYPQRWLSEKGWDVNLVPFELKIAVAPPLNKCGHCDIILPLNAYVAPSIKECVHADCPKKIVTPPPIRDIKEVTKGVNEKSEQPSPSIIPPKPSPPTPQYKTCRNCHHDHVGLSAQFCPKCGKNPDTVVSDKTCPKCQAINNVSANFCRGCGDKFSINMWR